MTIRLSVARLALLGLFLACMMISVILITVTFLRGAIYPSHVQQLILVVLAVYSVPLGTILGGMFGQRGDSNRPTSNAAFWVAMSVAVVWNLLLSVRVLIFSVADEDSVRELAGYLTAIAAASSFLVVGALAYFFTKKGSK